MLLAQKFARTPQLEIGFGDAKAIGGLFQHFEPLARFATFGGSDKDAVGIVDATANAAEKNLRVLVRRIVGEMA